MGSHKTRSEISAKHIRAEPGMKVLDLGCGPCEVLSYLPTVSYSGYDISEAYIEMARNRYGNRGQFYAKNYTADDIDYSQKFDIVLALGVLHHLSDDEALELARLASASLKEGGRLVTVDPCFSQGQSKLAKVLVAKDRGQHVRTEDEYRSIVGTSFKSVTPIIRHQKWIPYTHCIMECVK
jgi:cyclopropane fatty-acyl-phospholipid synthase-like methyltransferase